VILSHARKIFSTFTPATLAEDVEFLKALGEKADRIILQDKDFATVKEERLNVGLRARIAQRPKRYG